MIAIKQPDYGLTGFLEMVRKQPLFNIRETETEEGLSIIEARTSSFQGQLSHSPERYDENYITVTSAVLRDGTVLGGKNVCTIGGSYPKKIVTAGVVGQLGQPGAKDQGVIYGYEIERYTSCRWR